MRASLLDSLDDFERWGKGKDKDCAYVFPRGYRRERWSYQRVARVAYQFARELEARNIAKGDAVLLWSPNCAEWVAAFLGCALCGVIAVPVDDAASPDFAQRISAQVRTRLVLCPRERAAFFEKVEGGVAENVSCGDGASPRPSGAKPRFHTDKILTIDPVDLAAAVAAHPAERFCPAQIQSSDPLEIVFTSGTTAEPKGVVLTHANVVGNIAPIETEIKKYLKYERLVHPIRFLNLLPLSHVFGQFLGIFLPPLLGATVVFENTFNPTEVMATIRRERVSVLVAVPRMIESLKQKIERDLDDSADGGRGRENFAARYAAAERQHFLRRWWTFRDLRRRFGWKFWAMISGGAALDRATEEFWHRLGYAVVQGYGLTETTSLISLNHPFHTSRGSIGKVLPGREIKLAEDGEILVRGSGVASGYWNGRELQPVAREADEGWYRTGDLGALDEQGNLFFKGRKKEVIVTPAGMNIYPEDLEAALRSQKEVQDCVVVGLERGGNAEPCAVLILRARTPDASALFPSAVPSVVTNEVPSDAPSDIAQAIVERANKTLAEYQRMRAWFVWPEEDFPRSSTEKPRRNVIRDAVEASLRGQAPANAASPLSELLTRITGRNVQNLTPDANLESGLGLGSLERVELLSALEDRYQVDLSETKFANAATVGDLERLLQVGRSVVDRQSLFVGKPPERLATDDQRRTGAPRDPEFQRREFHSPAFHYPRWALRWPTTWLRLASHYLLARPAVLLLGWPRVTGRENLRGVSGPLLVISNHVADVDVGFIQFALPARIRHKLATATGGEALEILRVPGPDRPWLRRIYDRLQWTLGVALLNLFPLPRQSGFRKSFAYAGEAVDRGYSVLVFPEGKHTEDGKLCPFRTGVGLLANNLRIPILPMRIDGLFEIKHAGKKYAAPGKIQVRIGKPMQFPPETNPEEIARALQKAVEDLAG
ncbi:MAG TPA: AMP-binding protein [Terriglobales bacterium]|nr:AMP-binding protein [Terriglobales bacterium]